jgi:hypothetical protein
MPYYSNVFPTPMHPDGDSPLDFALRQHQQSKATKVASSNLFIEPQDVPIELMTDMTIESIGSLELINTARHNLITGNNILYKPFSKLSVLNSQYDPLKILALADGTPAQFDEYALALENYLPELDNVSIDESGNIIVEFINIEDGDFVEVEIISQGTLYSDIIEEIT